VAESKVLGVNMKIETRYAPAGTIAVCQMQAGDKLVAESGAFLASRGNIDIKTTIRQKKGGGIFSGLKRLVSGESFFINHFTAGGSSELWLGTQLPGDILVHELNGDKLIIQGGSYVACEQEINIDLEWQGLKSIFSGESLFWVKAEGKGRVILGSFGFIYPVQVDGEYIVDTGHIVAFEQTLNFTISKASKTWFQAYFGGEGFVCRFKGRGTVWCQSHNPRTFGQELYPYLRPRKG
jgi:uncharacterized protein (TIGR00266 family)